MTNIKKQIVTDDKGHPVAVQIAYADWIALEALMSETSIPKENVGNLAQHFGVMPLRVDPEEFQQQARGEWP